MARLFVEQAQAEPDTLLLERRATRPAREEAARAVEAAADGRATDAVGRLSRAMVSR